MTSTLSQRVLRPARRGLRFLGDVAASVQSLRYPADYHLPGGCARIYLYHIRKTGGTSLNQMFLAVGGEDGEQAYEALAQAPHTRREIDGRVYVGWNKALIEGGRYYYAFSHIPAHELRLPPRTFTITILRDPVARVLSLYRMLAEYRDLNVPHPMLARQGQWLGANLGDFLDRVPREHLLRQLFMFSPTFSPAEAQERILACSHVFFVEEFAAGVQALAARLDLSLTPMHAKKSAYKVDFDPAHLARLREMVEPEYVLCAQVRQALGAA